MIFQNHYFMELLPTNQISKIKNEFTEHEIAEKAKAEVSERYA